MRFNHKELALLAQQTNGFDIDGYLLMKDKQEGLFKKSEAYINRYFKLRGNLMFYYKSKDNKQDPLGVLILERCAVELDVEDEVLNGFLLVCEGEEHAFRFAASSEEERDKWIQALHIASHECLKMQFQSLREQLQARTGIDPIVFPAEPASSVDFESHSENASEDPVLEVSIACSNLPCDSADVAPNALVVVHTMLPPQQQIWMHHNHTEIVERNTNPHFLKTIGFGDRYGIDTSTRVRLTVHHVVERMTGTMTQLGQAIFTLQDILKSPDLTFSIKLKSHESKIEGDIKVIAWINDDRVSLAQLQTQQSGCYSKRPRTLSLGRHSHKLEAHFTNVIKRSFRFATNDEQSLLQVSEYMAESNWSFELPVQLLKLWVKEEKRMITILQDLGELVCEWESEQICWIRQGAETAEFYTNTTDILSEDLGITFKPSKDKSKQELEFVPVNLHMERMVVTSGSSNPKVYCYDIGTVGAFAAHCRDMKGGGLRRLLHQLNASFTPDHSSMMRTKLQRACSILNQVTNLRSHLHELCERLYATISDNDVEAIKIVVDSMKDKVGQLNKVCSDSLLQTASEAYLAAKRNANTSEGHDSASLTNISKSRHSENGAEKTWKWSGSDFVKSPTMEPWEVTALNLEAAFVCLISAVNEFVERKGKLSAEEENAILSEIKPTLSKIEAFLNVVWARISLFLTFLVVMEHKGHVKAAHDLKTRRDIVNAHAITTLVSSFVARTQSEDMIDPNFIKQLSTVGVLFQLEGLLSCYSSELSMLEDTVIAVDDLSYVSFRLTEVKNNDWTPKASLGSYVREGPFPTINRHNIIIDIPVSQEVFSHLSKDIQQGKQIKVTPVLFNIGINEMATLAEKIGSTALQEKLNMDSFARMYDYYSQYSKHFEDPLDKSHGVGSLNHMIKLLQNNVMTKKSKNVELLHSAAEVTLALKGLHATFCKSGKDRTSMGVTLEMVHILQRRHDLASHVFTHSLDCLRSVGCRRENTLKNTGVKKYAFVSLQMIYIPKLYRAPSGTYGNVQT